MRKIRKMKDVIKKLLTEAQKKISLAKANDELEKIKIEFLGRKNGKFLEIFKKIPQLDLKIRGEIGKLANTTKKKVEEFLEEKLVKITKNKTEQFFDFSVPGKKISSGYRHPISNFIRNAEKVFEKMGFFIADGPEIDDDWHNFEALNFPPDHPARESQDTFFIKDFPKNVLRSQTSNIQIHFMKNKKPPFRILAPGKCFRKDADATHSPMFHQFEGLMIDHDISLANLKFILQTALRELISPELEIRFRLSFFPFVEPGLEVDATCPQCFGKSKKYCSVCKNSGWLELGGAGMVHPNVLKNVNIDPKKWQGFAFGFGIERQIMIKNSVSDLRQFFENDIRFLQQF